MQALKPILLLEDDTLDAMIVRRTLSKLGIENRVIHRMNGEEGLDYLQASDTDWPCLVLLDLNMPRMNGLEFLERIQHHGTLCDLNVVILTTSNHREDMNAGFQLGAKGYVLKCIDSEKFARELSVVREYCIDSEEMQTA